MAEGTEQVNEQATGTDIVRNQINALRSQEVQANQNATEAPQEGHSGADPDEWYDGLDDATRAAVDAYSGGQVTKLQGALEAERKARRDFEKQVKELSKNAGVQGEAKQQLEALNTQLSEANTKAAFYEAAGDIADLPPKRYAAAYKMAKLDGLIDGDGTVDWDKLRTEYDYLFVPQQPKEEVKRRPGNAGNGVGTQPSVSHNANQQMNNLIRGKAG